MKLKPHLRYAVFAPWFAKHRAGAVPIKGEFYRVAGPRHTTAKEIVAGKGAYLGGGRWNPPGVMRVVYASADPVTAMHEATENRRYYGLPLWKGMPNVTVALRVRAEAVLDLTDRTIAADLPDPLATLMAEDWRKVMDRGEEAMTQALGRAAFGAGLQGLLLPSKPDPTGTNLLIFPTLLTAVSRLTVLNPEQLAKLGKPG